MKIEFDPAKDAKNNEKHDMPLALVQDFDFDSAIIIEDDRRNYGEKRFAAFGYCNGVLCNVIYTIRGDVRRIISLRRAREKERKRYDKET